MNKRQYPRQEWVLSPSFTPKEITIAEPYSSFAGGGGRDVSETGKLYHFGDLYPSKSDAIAAGRKKIEEQKAILEKRAASLAKREAALDKAEKGAAA